MAHKAQLLRKWPFYVERSVKRRTTLGLYGTLFNSSHWTQSTIINISQTTGLSQSFISENSSFILPFFLAPYRILTYIIPQGWLVTLTLTLFTLTKVFLYFFVSYATLFIDPDFIYELSAFSCTSLITLPYITLYYILQGRNYLNNYLPLLERLSGNPKLYTSYDTAYNRKPFSSAELDLHLASNTIDQVKTQELIMPKSSIPLYLSLVRTLRLLNIYNQKNLDSHWGGTKFVTKPAQMLPLHSVFTRSESGVMASLARQSFRLTRPMFALKQKNTSSVALNWLGFWNVTLTNQLVKQTTVSVQESRWLLHNFPNSSNFYKNSNLFTASKSLISVSDARSRQLINPKINEFSLGQALFNGEGLKSSTLFTGHYNFFETGRFFLDARVYNFSGLTSHFSNLSKVLKTDAFDGETKRIAPRLLSSDSENTATLKLFEPWIPFKKVSRPVSLTNYNGTSKVFTYKHNFTKPYMATSSDLIFYELLNSTSTAPMNTSTTTTYVNFTLPVSSNQKLRFSKKLKYC